MNIPNITLQNATSFNAVYSGDLPSKCAISTQKYSFECIYRELCPQIPSHIIKIGIIIIISYILISWFLWWFMNHGYKRFNWDMLSKHKGLNLYILDNRIYWDIWIRERISHFMIGYIAMVVFFNITV